MKQNFEIISILDLQESKINPRSHFDEAGLKELADSMRAQGILEPLIVRSLGERIEGGKPAAGYEVIIGARRFRAAKLAKLTELPALVRELTNGQAIELQIIENLQREDLQPLDEARGYRGLIELWTKDRGTQNAPAEQEKSDVDRVAEKIGKSASYVYQRLKLADLIEPGQKALAEGKITAGHAVLLARLIPNQQGSLLSKLKQDGEYDQFPTVRELGEYIQREIHRNLDAAPWKKEDPLLLPAAGNCAVCPKRAGNNPALYHGLKPDICTDRECFEAKIQAFLAKRKQEEEIRLKAASSSPTKAEQKLPKPKTPAGPAVLELSESWDQNQKDGVICSRWWREIGKKDKTCGFTRPGILIDGTRIGHMIQVCTERGCKIHRPEAFSSSDNQEWKTEAKRKQEKNRELQRTNEAIFKAVIERVQSLNRADLEAIATHFFRYLEYDRKIAFFRLAGWEAQEKKHNWGGKFKDYDGGVKAKIASLSESGLARFLLGCALINDVPAREYISNHRETLLAAAKRYKIDLRAIEREISEHAKSKAAKKAKSAKKKRASKAVAHAKPSLGKCEPKRAHLQTNAKRPARAKARKS